MDKCPCAAIDSPDDMWLGMNLIDGLSSDLTQGSCSRRLDVPLVHHSGFHQAKPQVRHMIAPTDLVLRLMLTDCWSISC